MKKQIVLTKCVLCEDFNYVLLQEELDALETFSKSCKLQNILGINIVVKEYKCRNCVEIGKIENWNHLYESCLC